MAAARSRLHIPLPQTASTPPPLAASSSWLKCLRARARHARARLEVSQRTHRTRRTPTLAASPPKMAPAATNPSPHHTQSPSPIRPARSNSNTVSRSPSLAPDLRARRVTRHGRSDVRVRRGQLHANASARAPHPASSTPATQWPSPMQAHAAPRASPHSPPTHPPLHLQIAPRPPRVARSPPSSSLVASHCRSLSPGSLLPPSLGHPPGEAAVGNLQKQPQPLPLNRLHSAAAVREARPRVPVG
ncbi:hypothetical protein K466DRAFT_174757 [Polyporus arcularius HHB13444]|uniref:Uncharacterized protein n=1 Tax=Polyporus arcularius HHB13444 TaxID=1314778 RepID=A0A5C3PB12_9APHY|nr:hypothetical protein K466DRAFT_174757 [Polyporus arcularius HHB13444]